MKITKFLKNIPNGQKIYQYCLFQGPLKYTQIGIFGLKVYHLSTLVEFVLSAALAFLDGEIDVKGKWRGFCTLQLCSDIYMT
jgi:hypothetical protein